MVFFFNNIFELGNILKHDCRCPSFIPVEFILYGDNIIHIYIYVAAASISLYTLDLEERT